MTEDAKSPNGSRIASIHLSSGGEDAAKKDALLKENEAKEFAQAFLGTLDRKGTGLLTPYLFHDLSVDDHGRFADVTYHALQRHFGRMLYGGNAWDEHLKTTADYAFPGSDLSAIQYAISNGMVSELPQKLKFIEYGPGGRTGVSKPTAVIRSILEEGSSKISSYVAVDILSRYATESAQFIYEEFDKKFGLNTYSVIGDFTSPQKLMIPNGKDSVPLVAIFGGAFANAPDLSNSYGPDSIETATTNFSQMSKQHGLGSYTLISYDAESDPDKLLKQYAPTPAFEAFLLSAFTRAVEQGVITDQGYDVFENWEMSPDYIADKKLVSLDAVCKNDHIIQTTEGDYRFQKGDRLPIILSYKWNEANYTQMLQNAGYEIVNQKAYQEPGSTRGIILAQAVHAPK